MKTRPLTDEIRAMAEVTLILTLEEAETLPGFLGRLASVNLERFGWYSCRYDGLKTLFVLKHSTPGYVVEAAALDLRDAHQSALDLDAALREDR